MPEVLESNALEKLIDNYIFYKYLNGTLVMIEVLGPDALGKLIHYYIFYKCLNKTLVMSKVLKPNALGKLIHYKCLNRRCGQLVYGWYSIRLIQ